MSNTKNTQYGLTKDIKSLKTNGTTVQTAFTDGAGRPVQEGIKIKALRGKVLVTDLERGSRVIGGIIIPDDNGKSQGIRPRWGRVYSIGDDISDIAVGQWILIENGRWTRMLKIKDETGADVQVWGVEWPKAVMLVSDNDPEGITFSEWA